MQLQTFVKERIRLFLFLFLLLFSFIPAHGEEYVFSRLYDSDFQQIDSNHPLCLNLKGRTYYLGFFKDFYGNPTISLVVNGESVGMYAYEQYQNGWYIYKSCIPYAGCSILYVYKDKSVIRHSGLYDAGYFSEARLVPAQNKKLPDW